jgi:imidazole glycerol-phosphate synthase subunit HisF
MLKVRVIPILTFNGFGLVKTKNFSEPRMVGNPVQAARVYNSRGVDELVFLDIFASVQKRKLNLKLVGDVIKECYMPVAIGGGIETIEDINSLLKIGADKVVIKTKALTDTSFIKQAVAFFGSQCITIAVDVVREKNSYKVFNKIGIDIMMDDFIKQMEDCEVGEFVLTSVDCDGMMHGFDVELVDYFMSATKIPVIAVGGGGEMTHYSELFTKTKVEAVGSASIFHFTQFTPMDIKKELLTHMIPVRM